MQILQGLRTKVPNKRKIDQDYC